MNYLLRINTDERIKLWKEFKVACAIKDAKISEVLWKLIADSLKDNKVNNEEAFGVWRTFDSLNK